MSIISQVAHTSGLRDPYFVSMAGPDCDTTINSTPYEVDKYFGNSAVVESYEYWTCALNRMEVFKQTLLDTDSITKLTANISGEGSGTGDQVVKGVIYDNDGSAGAPGTLLGTTAEVTVTDGQARAWVDLTFAAPVALSAGDYYIGLHFGANTQTIRFFVSASGGTRYYVTDTYADGPAATFTGGASTGSENGCLYASYVSEYTPRTYYVDPTTGSDSDTGLSEALAWATVAKVDATILYPGDQVLFKRGEVWRSTLPHFTYSGTSGYPITYGAYGTGDKPLFLGSIDLSATGDWTAEGTTNIWKTTATHANGSGLAIYDYEESLGKKMGSIAECIAQGDFAHNSGGGGTNLIYMYSVGNPGTYYSHIEISTSTDLTVGDAGISYITLDNLAIKYTGSGGFWLSAGAGVNDHIIFQFLDVAYVGGGAGTGDFGMTGRGGDAYSFMGAFTDSICRYCTADQVWDIGFSAQRCDSGTASDIEVYGNVFRRCDYGFSVFGQGGTYLRVLIHHNVCYDNGGFAMDHKAAGTGTGYIAWSLMGTTHTDCEFTDNIVHTSRSGHIYITSGEGGFLTEAGWTFDRNHYYPDGPEAFLINTESVDTYMDFADYKTLTTWDANSDCDEPKMAVVRIT